ncbi:hypothetical protein I204_00177 [Kwoniella mangroviensis CBS 8886]|nr:hypothetical protein I204_00177 [Kwoniella mangroviensis CBS 8886]
MLTSTQPPILPPEILILIFQNLQEAGSMKTLSSFRQVSKSSYSLASPVLVSSSQVPVSHLINLYNHHRSFDTYEIAAIETGFSFSSSGHVKRKLYDLSLIQNLTLVKYPMQNRMPNIPTLSAWIRSGIDERTSNNLPKVAHTKPPFLPQLTELTFSSFILQDIALHLSSSSSEGIRDQSPDTVSFLVDLGHSAGQLRTIRFKYPSSILDQRDMDLTGRLAKSIRSLIALFPSIKEMYIENVHLQPLLLPAPRKGLKKIVVEFSRHAKCPDMGGVVFQKRKEQLREALLDLTRQKGDIFDELLESQITKYELRDAIGSIPQWEGAEDIEAQANELEDMLKRGMQEELMTKSAHRINNDLFNLVERVT